MKSLLPLLFLLLSLPAWAQPRFAKGADVGWLTEMEDSGRVFYNAAGQKQDLLQILKAEGLDAIRVRVWVNPEKGYNGLADVLKKALRIKAAGIRLMVDFHYSDDWADPGKQPKPRAWKDFTADQLKGAVYAHTLQVLDTLRAHQIAVEWVQVGNEITHGMLWPEGRAEDHMADFAQMVDTGYAAVKRVYPQSQVVVHLDNGWDSTIYRFVFDGFQQHKVRYDAIGMSLYPKADTWRDFVNKCLYTSRMCIRRYNKPILVTEVGMPVQDSLECRRYIATLIAKLQALPGHKGQGVFFWEPQAYNWHGYNLIAWGRNGRPTQAMKGFTDPSPLATPIPAKPKTTTPAQH